jgi:hypothetical protein
MVDMMGRLSGAPPPGQIMKNVALKAATPVNRAMTAAAPVAGTIGKILPSGRGLGQAAQLELANALQEKFRQKP